MPERAAAREAIASLAGGGDIVVVMGAGDVDELGRELVGAGRG
jgi:UDP-N-acetylmuramate-alanine ligase